MTVSSSTDRATFPGNGVTTLFPLPFRFFQNADIQASLVDDTTFVVTPLSLGIHYTLIGAGEPEADGSPVSSLTMLIAPPSGKTLSVLRVMPVTQPTDIINQARFYPEIHENVFDRLTMLIQQALGVANNSLQLDPTGQTWDARGSRIINVANPISPQDAATMQWAIDYISGILATGQGPVNNAANVLFSGANGYLGVVQDLSSIASALKGTSMLGLFGGGNLGQLNRFVTPAMKGAIAGADATAAIQAALDDPRPIVLIDEIYKVNVETRMRPPSGKKIVFIGNARLEALAATSAFYSVFDLENVSDIDFVNPVLVGDRDIHLGVGGEQGFGIRALSVKRVRIFGGDISKMWGDGIYFGATNILTHTNCEDITVIGLNSHHNRRQGMSLTGVVRGHIENSKFNDTNGTNPQSGVDLEPNAGFQTTDIHFENCEALRNAGAGFELLDALNNGNVRRITFNNCPARGNGSNGLRLVSALEVTHTGEISGNTSHGVYAIQGSNNLSLPEPNIHNNGGDGVQAITGTMGVRIGKGRIYLNAGYGVLINSNGTLSETELFNNTSGGWYFGAASIRSRAINLYVHDNGGTGGESAAGSSQTTVTGGEYTSNSTTTNLGGHNLAIYGNGCHVTGDVKLRVGTNANKPAYGLRSTGNSDLVCKGNDFRGGGVTGDTFLLTLTNADVSDNFPYQRVGTTAQRPTLYLIIGQPYYDQSLGKPIWWFGANWRDAAGTVV